MRRPRKGLDCDVCEVYGHLVLATWRVAFRCAPGRYGREIRHLCSRCMDDAEENAKAGGDRILGARSLVW